MEALFGASWGDFCRGHSRYYARSRGLRISRLWVADKLAFVLTPARLYLPLARASGEFAKYMKQSKERQAGNEYFTSSESARLESNNPQEWLKGLQSYTYRWVLKNRNADGNGPNLEYHDLAAFIERLPFERTELTAAKPADTTYHFLRLGSSSTQILGDGFDPLPFRPEPVGLGASHFEWGYRVAVPKSRPRVCWPISWRMIGWHWDSAPSRLWLLQSYQEATRGLNQRASSEVESSRLPWRAARAYAVAHWAGGARFRTLQRIGSRCAACRGGPARYRKVDGVVL